MRSTLLLAALLLAAGSAAAQYPGPDNIGLYTSVDSDVAPIAGATVPLHQTLDLHCCITQPSGDQVIAWQARVDTQNAGAFLGFWSLVDGLNVTAAPDFVVGLGSRPLSPNAHGVVKLMTLNLLLLDDSEPVRFFIRPVSGSPIEAYPNYQASVSTDPVRLEQSTGGRDVPVFVINGEVPVANEPASWGAVRSLYRAR